MIFNEPERLWERVQDSHVITVCIYLRGHRELQDIQTQLGHELSGIETISPAAMERQAQRVHNRTLETFYKTQRENLGRAASSAHKILTQAPGITANQFFAPTFNQENLILTFGTPRGRAEKLLTHIEQTMGDCIATAPNPNPITEFRRCGRGTLYTVLAPLTHTRTQYTGTLGVKTFAPELLPHTRCTPPNRKLQALKDWKDGAYRTTPRTPSYVLDTVKVDDLLHHLDSHLTPRLQSLGLC